MVVSNEMGPSSSCSRAQRLVPSIRRLRLPAGEQTRVLAEARAAQDRLDCLREDAVRTATACRPPARWRPTPARADRRRGRPERRVGTDQGGATPASAQQQDGPRPHRSGPGSGQRGWTARGAIVLRLLPGTPCWCPGCGRAFDRELEKPVGGRSPREGRLSAVCTARPTPDDHRTSGRVTAFRRTSGQCSGSAPAHPSGQSG